MPHYYNRLCNSQPLLINILKNIFKSGIFVSEKKKKHNVYQFLPRDLFLHTNVLMKKKKLNK